MGYRIKPYTFRRARALGVTVKPSTRKGKKIDVFKNGKKVASVGAIGYGDFPTFTMQRGKAFADKRRKAYREFWCRKKQTFSYFRRNGSLRFSRKEF